MPTLLLVTNDKSWPGELRRAMPELEVRHYPEVGDPGEIDYVLAWMPKLGLLKSLPNLKVIFSLASGVDHLLRDPDLPKGIPIVRMNDPNQANQMSEYAVMAVLYFHRGMHFYRTQQPLAGWTQVPTLYTPDHAVGVMGLGNIGRTITSRLKVFGFEVHGWSRTPHDLPGVKCHHGPEGLSAMLAQCRYLVNVLPATPLTRGILNQKALETMPRGSFVINLGRGVHVVDDDLLAALDEGQIEGAFLDVFTPEPLPPMSRYWHHPRVFVTPHMAGELLSRTAALSVVAGIKRHMAGEPLTYVYDSSRGY